VKLPENLLDKKLKAIFLESVVDEIPFTNIVKEEAVCSLVT